MGGEKTGVILLNLGGPDTQSAVKPFLYNLFSDREIIRLGPTSLQKPLAWLIAQVRSKKTMENYNKIGGHSPLPEITSSQAQALEETLRKRGADVRCYVGMRYWKPFISEAVEKAYSDGAKKLIALPLFPQYSRATTGSCFKALDRASKQGMPDITYIDSWFNHPAYVHAVSKTVSQGLKEFDKGDVPVIFSAHALPRSFVDEGDPYVAQVNSTIDRVVDETGLEQWELSFQSRSGPVKWIGPSTEEVIKSLADKGVKRALMVPITFVSDHIETLYEMDMLYKGIAEKLGMRLERAESLNTSPDFINALAEITEQHLQG